MHKIFESKIPLSYQESFKIIQESGQEISDWVLVDSNAESGCIEWKQIFWSGLGFAKIKVELREIENLHTLATTYIFRPIQIWDPAKLCERVFKKLEERIIKNIALLNK